MSHAYVPVQWNRQKQRYDLWVAAGTIGAIVAFAALTLVVYPQTTAESLVIRATGATAFVMLTFVLCIGPLARLTPRVLPLLYNRRHLGVATFLVAAVHGSFAIVHFHALGDINPLTSVLVGAAGPLDGAGVPFQAFGLLALLFLALMAATSHDFWLANLTAPVWKALHMGVYIAYLAIVAHVLFGAYQDQQHAALAIAVGGGFVLVATLHIVAARRRLKHADAQEEWLDVCAPLEIPDGRARVIGVGGERAAVFRSGNTISALSAVCQHQNGPLGEGCIIDGLVTCPWHGYQYDPLTGASPAPFTERVPTFDVRLVDGRIQIASRPNAPGSRSQAVEI